jgi:CDP-6-deoxy-D-xylo-4-hexulose-3-dehydrase
MMKNQKYIGKLSELKNADNVMKRGVLLPVHHGMTNKMFTRLHNTIEDFLKDY